MAQLKDLIVNGPARVINDLYVNGTIYESGSSLAVKYAPATHTHAASDITSGTFPASLLPADVEYTSRMVTSVTSSATDTTYPSAKAVYNSLTKVNRIFRGTCATAAATAAKSVTCAEYDALTVGDVIFVVFSYANTAAGSSLTLSVNGTTAKQIRVQLGSQERIHDSAQFKTNFPYMFVYDGTYWTTVSNTDLTVGALSTQQLVSDGGSLYRWMIVLSDRSGALIPFSNGNNQPTTYTKTVTTHTFDPFGKIAFYNNSTTVAASGTIPASNILYSHNFSAQYSINVATSGTAGTTAFTARKPVYIKAKYNANTGLATLAPGTDTTNYLAYSSVTQTLPATNPNTGLSSNEEYIYIYLGSTDSTAYMMAMDPFHPVYHWDSDHGCMTVFGGSGSGGGGSYQTVFDLDTLLADPQTSLGSDSALLPQGSVAEILAAFTNNEFAFIHVSSSYSGTVGTIYAPYHISSSDGIFVTNLSDDGFYTIMEFDESHDEVTWYEANFSINSNRSTTSSGAVQNSTITNWTQKLIAPVNYTVGASAAPAALVAAPPAGFIVGDQFVSADGWLGTVTTDMGSMGASVNFNIPWLAPHKLTVNSTQYTVSRKALTIVDGSTTTTYYVADLTT